MSGPNRLNNINLDDKFDVFFDNFLIHAVLQTFIYEISVNVGKIFGRYRFSVL